MILDKTLEKRYYVNLNDVTAYNWDMLTKNNDYQFICKPGQTPDEHAPGVYQHLLFQFDALDLSSLKDRRDIALKVIDMLMSLSVKYMHVNELKVVSTLLRALIIKPERRLVEQIRKHLKSSDDKMQLSFFPMMISGKVYEDLAEILSSKTIDFLNGFKDDYFGYPPELNNIFNKKFVLF